MISRLIVVAAVLVVLSAWTHARPRVLNAAPVDVAASLPLVFGEWAGRDAPPLEPAVAEVLAADQYVHRYYGLQTADRGSRMADGGSRMADGGLQTADRGSRTADGGSRIEMDIAYYAQPQAGAAMHSPLNCLPGNGWQVIESRVAPVRVDRGTVDVRRLLVARGGHRVAMTYWFQNRGAVVGSEYRQRLRLLTNGLQGRPTDAALVRVMARDDPRSHESLARFTRELLGFLTVAFAQ